MLKRQLQNEAEELLTKFPILTITGPRQSGKTTFIKHTFPTFEYYSLENPDIRKLILGDPKGFLDSLNAGVIFDEVQRVPELFSYIQTFSDENPTIKLILSGSQNFQLMESISQSLAGRTAILKLLPFSFAELKEDSFSNVENYEKLIFYGSFPRIYDKHIDPADFYPNYIQTYVERDIRQIKNILDLDNFIKFVRLCAARVGQLLNLNSLATDVGITFNTAKSWLSVLESSYIVYRIKPYHKSFNKRLVKMQKLYFYDTGLACSLVGIENQKQLSTYYQKGELFENLVINEFIKQRYNNGKIDNLYFWRNNHGNEIDCVINQFETDMVVEIKSSATYSASFFKNINYWHRLSNSSVEDSYVIYTGDKTLKTKQGMLISWKELDKFLGLI